MRKGSIDAANIESCDQSTKDMHLNSIYTELLESYQMKAQKLLNDVGKPIYGYTFKRELRGVNPEVIQIPSLPSTVSGRSFNRINFSRHPIGIGQGE